MKTVVLCKSYLMGTICPLVIYLAAGAYDIITQEDNSALNVMVIEGLLLFALPCIMKESTACFGLMRTGP